MAKVLTIVDLNKSGKKLVLPSESLPPTDENIAKLTQGAYIKVGLAGDDYPNSPVEYSWAEFNGYGVAADLITATINNDLLFTKLHGWADGDILTIKPENVLAILY